MITKTGYSKDPSIMPDGIAITFGKSMIDEQGGLKTFLTGFKAIMDGDNESSYWMHKMKNMPQFDIPFVYIIIANRLAYRCQFAGYNKNPEPIIGYGADGNEKEINWSYIILAPPLVKCPFKRTLKGFQGFRYTEELF